MIKMPSSTLELVKSPGRTQHINQIISTAAVSVATFSVGLCKGFTSPALDPLLESRINAHDSGNYERSSSSNTITITNQELSWIASLSLLGALVGGGFSGYMLKRGRRKAILLMSIPMVMSWLLTAFATNVKMIYCSSFFVGGFSSITMSASQLYISEISHPSIRASLCSFSKVSYQLGVLTSYCMGAFMDWKQMSWVCGTSPLMFLITAMYIPETPSFLLKTNQETRALKSLQWLRGYDTDVSAELSTIHANILKQKTQPKSWRVSMPILAQPLLITCGLMAFQRFSGVNAFNHYAVQIFRESLDGSFNPNFAAAITCVVQLVASALSGVLCDYVGRLPLLVLTGFLTAMAMAGCGAFEHFKPLFIQSGEPTFWIPLVLVQIYVGAFYVGIGPISTLYVAELFPLEFREVGNSVVSCFSYICAFASVKSFVDMCLVLGMAGTYWVYAGICLAGVVFIILFAPETKGKTLDEMQPVEPDSLPRQV